MQLDSQSAKSLPRRIRLNWYGGPQLRAGERWQLKVRLKRPHGFANPGGDDHERWLFARGIGATGYVRPDGPNRRLAESSGLADWRQRIADFIDAELAGSPYRGIIKALAVGAQEGITERQWEVLRRTGTAHLVAISGLHIAMVAGLTFWLGRKAWLWFGHWRLAADQIGALLAFPSALGYAALAGFSLPTQRALIMLGAALWAGLWRRRLDPGQAFGAALLLVGGLDPLAPLSASFWLSFGAVAWILYAVSGRLRPPRWALMKVQGYLFLGLAPCSIFFFQQVGGTAPLANLVAVPVVSFGVVPWVLVSCALASLAPALAALLLAGSVWVLERLWPALAWLAGFHNGAWPLPPPPLWSLPLACLGIAWLLAPRGLPARWLGGVLLSPLIWGVTPRPASGELWVTVLDVGQGLAAVAETQNHVLVYDTGPGLSERFDAGSDIIAPFLRQAGRRRLDLIVLSHGDFDHSGGLVGLMQSFPAPVLTSAAAKFQRFGAAPCQAGQRWEWDGVKFSLLWPENAEPARLGKENDRSCVLKIETGAGAVLFPGDLERIGEAALVRRYGASLKAPVLIVPHHGSATSSSWLFLRAVQPKYALIASGYRNRFGFPSQKVLARYRSLGTQVFDTARDGAIRARLGPTVEVTAWRRLRRWIWSWRPSAESEPF
nr:DNA internalization-related competence protein ComEC/Rec2 [uncultured Gammaproteobacteria bacterium]